MHIDIEKVISHLEIEDGVGYFTTFQNDLSVGKERILQLLDEIEKDDLSVWVASDEADELENELNAEILKLLQKNNVPITRVSTFTGSEEEYVNEYPTYFEWEVMGVLNFPMIEMYYTKEDIEWMRKLLSTPFDAPTEERLQIYRDWSAHWKTRQTIGKPVVFPKDK